VLGLRLMDELRESSLLFSLEGLLETERDRVQREAREAQKRRDEEMARVAEAAERRRVQLQQQRESLERREALERERERFEQERIEAMKRATIERARLEVESSLRLAEAEQGRQHELSLARTRAAAQTARYRALTWLSTSAFALSVCGALGMYLGMIAPAHARAQHDLQRLLDSRTELGEARQRALDAQLRKNEELRARVAELEAAASAAAPPPGKVEPKLQTAPPRPVPGTTPKPDGPCVDNGDPLSPCLKR
jgi:hypothetical protein